MRKNKQLRKFWYSLSASQRFRIRQLYYAPADIMDAIRGKRHRYVPPRGYIYTGSPSSAENYLEQGREQVALMQEEIGLQPTDVVLDIGSGIGRTAIALSEFLNEEGAYEGFDVVKQGVDWCNKRIGADHSNFNFTYVPLFNDLYNTATLKASEFVFPYTDQHFDKIFSFSVFTHMGIDEIAHSLKEIKRVLKPGGKCLSTFFVYADENEDFIAEREGFAFPYKGDGYRLMDENVKSGNIAIHKDTLEQMMQDAGLELIKLEEGFWKHPQQAPHTREYQDIVIFG